MKCYYCGNPASTSISKINFKMYLCREDYEKRIIVDNTRGVFRLADSDYPETKPNPVTNIKPKSIIFEQISAIAKPKPVKRRKSTKKTTKA